MQMNDIGIYFPYPPYKPPRGADRSQSVGIEQPARDTVHPFLEKSLRTDGFQPARVHIPRSMDHI